MTETDRPIRVLVAKVGLDGHDRGAKVIARALRDAGMEVIYTGLHRRPEDVVTSAIQEDVDVIGVSSSLLQQLDNARKDRHMSSGEGGADENTLVLGGGVMPDEDVEELKKMGIAEILGQDTPPDAVVETVRHLVEERGARV